MSDAEMKTPAPAELSQLQAKFDALNHLVVSVLILLVIISGTLTIYLLRQWSSTRKDLAAARPGAIQIIAEYNKERGPRMDAFINKLTDYGRTHTNFIPILLKYGVNPSSLTSAPPAAVSPAPASARKK